ncbi:MAG: hypothetical protein H0T11_07225 [Chthoniobacterales bacterium]|nr:hypothetical protein [Chthoniobacterales bacterium]
MIGQPRPAISATSVRLYERAPRNFDQIAIVQGRTGNELRAQAAAVGANGLLVRDVVTRPGPTIGFGIGSSTFSTSRRSVIGVGTGASFITPLRGGQVIEALAIYVR